MRPIALLYGGKSTEHEVSCRSAAFVWKNLDRSRYQVFAIGVDKQGTFHPQDPEALHDQNLLPIRPFTPATPTPFTWPQWGQTCDFSGVVFSLLHGNYGEDGRIQGLLDSLNITYVGSDTFGSVASMDKIIAKKVMVHGGVAIAPFVELHQADHDSSALSQRCEHLGPMPWFVKPARNGSSVGVSRVDSEPQLEKAVEQAFQFDSRILVEKGIAGREIEFAVLGHEFPRVSCAGEIVVNSSFYDYQQKYSADSDSRVIIPKDLSPATVRKGQQLSQQVFRDLGLSGMARIDFFLTTDGSYVFNEANSLPGFTEISQYPKLWEQSGLGPSELLNELIEIALQRQRPNTNHT